MYLAIVLIISGIGIGVSSAFQFYKACLLKEDIPLRLFKIAMGILLLILSGFITGTGIALTIYL